ncbi:MAG: ribonuclease P protein component [Clostridia bacterium]|nr:ribonuclease P protein component [Clostridia bacterium]
MSEIITLCDAWAFRRAYRQGKSFVAPELVTYVIKNKQNNLRIGITTGKKIGKAVLRSRARRVIRAAFREVMNDSELLKSGFDVVFVARGKTPYIKSTALSKVMKKQLKESSLIK